MSKSQSTETFAVAALEAALATFGAPSDAEPFTTAEARRLITLALATLKIGRPS